MKLTLLMIIFLLSTSFSGEPPRRCSSENGADGLSPNRLVVIEGKATIVNFPGGALPATSERLIFQKIGCESCFIGADVDKDGKYRILVGDGKYKLIVRNPSSPEVDWIAPDQERIIDTESQTFRNQILNFDIKIKMPN